MRVNALFMLLFATGFASCQSPPSAAAQASRAVVSRLAIAVPADDAELKIDGRVIAGKGPRRQFETPPLKAGASVTYDVEVSWNPNRYTVMHRKSSIAVNAGETVTVDLAKATDKDRGEVIFVPTPREIVGEMADLAAIGPDDVVFDLGCGDGRMVIAAVQRNGAKRGVGIEIRPEIAEQAREGVKHFDLADRVEIRQGDVFDDAATAGLEDATVVMLYMGDELDQLLRPKLLRTLKPGARIVSHQFLMGDWKPDRTVAADGLEGGIYSLHLWIVKESDKKRAAEVQAPR